MKKEVIASGKDLAEAQQNARLALGAGELDDITFETIDLGSRGIFGIIGVRPAKVKASMEIAKEVLAESTTWIRQLLFSSSKRSRARTALWWVPEALADMVITIICSRSEKRR